MHFKKKAKLNVYLRSLKSRWPVHRFAKRVGKREKKRDIKKNEEKISIHGHKT